MIDAFEKFEYAQIVVAFIEAVRREYADRVIFGHEGLLFPLLLAVV